MSGYCLYLASASPRRSELLLQLDASFRVLAVEIDESPALNEPAPDYVRRLAREKANAARAKIRKQNLPDYPVLAADTSVVVDGRILGKPANRREAKERLGLLQDREHQVYTAVCLLGSDDARPALAMSCSDVEFGPLCAKEIEAYCDTGEPMDKAGGYGIQGRAGAFIKSIRGSYSGIVGLPMYETRRLLIDQGIL